MRISDKTEGLLNWQELRSGSGRLIYIIMFTFLMILALICLLPVLWMCLSAFKTTQEMYTVPPTIFPSSIDFGRVTRLWETAEVGKYFLNSIAIIIGCWAFDVSFNGIAGYVLSRIRPVGSIILSTMLMWTMMMPGISMAPLFMTFVDVPFLHINLTGTFLPIWLMAGASAFNIFLFRNFFNGIPMDYIEAARIDGCGNLRAFFKIILPMSVPIIAVVTIFSIINSWSNFFWPYLVLGNTKLEPVSVMLYKVTTMGQLQANDKVMILIFATIPSVIVYAIFSKKIVGGINLSGIKG